MEGRAAALGAGTVLNALATGTGSAFALDVEPRATGPLAPDSDGVAGAAYAVLHPEDRSVDLHRTGYDVDGVVSRVEESDLPDETGARLLDGR